MKPDNVAIKKIKDNKYELSYNGIKATFLKDGDKNVVTFHNKTIKSIDDIFDDEDVSKIYKVASDLSLK